MNSTDKKLLKTLQSETGLGEFPCAAALERSETLDQARALLKEHGARLSVIHIDEKRAQVEAARAKETTEKDRSHHAESASSLQTKEWCPRFRNQGGTSEAAELGTRQHYAAETGNMSGLSDHEAEKVQECLDWLTDRYKGIRAEYPDAKLVTESYGEIDELEWPTMNERSTSGGFVDVEILFDGGKQAEIWDYKFGRWAVEPAENNLQGIVYLLNRFKKTPQLEKCTVGFMMPYLAKIDYHVFERKDFEKLYIRVKRLVTIRQYGKNLSENPSFNSCMWCANMVDCKAITKAVVGAVTKFAPLKVPANPDPNAINDKSDISAWLTFADVCKMYAASIRYHCTEETVTNKDLVPDSHELVKQDIRVVKKVNEYLDALRQFGVTEESLDKIRKVSLTDGEKAVAATMKRGEKTAQLELFKEHLAEKNITEIGQTKIFLKAKREKAD
jgi:hypothetical protein